jgi:hypothetical protein
MDQPKLKPQPGPAETTEDRITRLAWEARALQEAERSFEEEGGIPIEEVVAWVDSWDTPNELSPPEPRKDEAWARIMAEKVKAGRT